MSALLQVQRRSSACLQNDCKKKTLDSQTSINLQLSTAIRDCICLVYWFCILSKPAGRHIFPSPFSLSMFPVHTYSLGIFFLTPILHSYKIFRWQPNIKMCTRMLKNMHALQANCEKPLCKKAKDYMASNTLV